MPSIISIYGELSDLEKEVIALRAEYGAKQVKIDEIAKKLGISRKGVLKITNRITTKNQNNKRIQLGLIKPEQLEPKS